MAQHSRSRALKSVLLASASMFCFGSGPVLSQEESGAAHLSNEELVQRLLRMEKRMHMLEDRLAEKESGPSARGSKALAAKEKKPSAPPSAPEPGRTAAPPVATAAVDPPAATDTMFDRARRALASTGEPVLGVAPSPVQGLTIGAYGEVKYGRQQNPAAGAKWVWQTTAPGVGNFVWQNSAPGGTWQNGFDAARFVLLPTYAITDNIIFNAEIEFEHGGVAFDDDDKLHGSAEIEQIFVDFKFDKYFNLRSPGIDLVPIGYINQHHEPTQFYSVNRPELYNGLIPSTWKAPAAGAYGQLTDDLSYQVQISQSLEDYGGSYENRTDANTVPFYPVGYAPGVDGVNALGFSLAPFGDFRQLSSTYAFAGRLDYRPSFIPGLAGSVSGYYTPNVTPRAAYSDYGTLLGKTSLGMFDAELRYRMPDAGLEVRGEYVRVNIGNPANLRANNDTDPTNNVGKYMDGYSAEVAYHIPLATFFGDIRLGAFNGAWEAVPFYRYTRENFQHGGYAGTDLNIPLGAGQLQYHTVGVALFPTPQLVLKANYQKVISNEPWGAQSDAVLGGLGFFF